MTIEILVENFERIDTSIEGSCANNLAQTSIDLGRIAMQFSRIERMPRYKDGRRESDAEHSFMLALTAPELAKALELDLDPGLLSQFSMVHDLVELKTNDIATLLLSSAELEEKEALEAAALKQLFQELPPYTAHMLERYEHQDEQEARFVRFIDKLLPIVVDILGDGQRVLREDYHITTTHELHEAHTSVHNRLDVKFGSEYPEISQVHAQLCRIAERLIQFH